MICWIAVKWVFWIETALTFVCLVRVVIDLKIKQNSHDTIVKNLNVSLSNQRHADQRLRGIIKELRRENKRLKAAVAYEKDLREKQLDASLIVGSIMEDE